MSFIRFLPAYLALLFAASICGEEYNDFYTSISGMESLLELEYHLLHNLKDYVDQELAKHQQINSILEDFENENAKALNHSEEYFSSPINVFKAIKRSVVDFKDLENYILERYNEEGYEDNVTRIESDLGLSLAKDDDLKGAVIGFARLQQTYKLNTSDLAAGRILGVQYSDAMSASESYYVGRKLYDEHKYELSFEWLSDAWEKFKNHTPDEWGVIDEVQILQVHSAAAYAAGKFQTARSLAKELLLINPSNEYAQENIKIVDMDIFEERNTYTRRTRAQKVQDEKTPLLDLYQATCRGELHRTPTEERPLRCMYVHNNVPFLQIAPFKMEQLSLDPLMVYYHEVIYEDEIKKVLDEAAPNIIRSRVGDSKHYQISSIRTSKNTWLEFHEHNFLENIKQRLLDMTQLSLDTAEALQVANYGIGGHYGPHYDFFPDDRALDKWIGNRMATALFYISDVELGGATAFPLLKLAVKPVRRSLVFWMNLHNSTDPDYRMKHAGCPVLKGSKWILNEWIHEGGQEFIHPCGLQSTAYLSAEYAKS